MTFSSEPTGQQIKAVRTPWAAPGDKIDCALKMNALLDELGIYQVHVRRRLFEHAIVACGWSRNCWNHNLWGVKKGKSWKGDWVVLSGWEEIDGVKQPKEPMAWRAFGSFAEALADYLQRLNYAQYADARVALFDPDISDEDFFRALKKGKYFTANIEKVVRDVRYFRKTWGDAGLPLGSDVPSLPFTRDHVLQVLVLVGGLALVWFLLNRS